VSAIFFLKVSEGKFGTVNPSLSADVQSMEALPLYTIRQICGI